MNKVTFPLTPQMQSGSVADLQDALQLLLDRGILEVNADKRLQLLAGLQTERAGKLYGPVTKESVERFQNGLHIPFTGSVDEHTAAALNTALEKLGAFAPTPDAKFLVAGKVSTKDGVPFTGGRARAFHSDTRGKLRLGEDDTDAEGRYTISYSAPPGVDAVQLQVEVNNPDGTSLGKSALVAGAKPLEILDLVVQIVDLTTFQVDGKVASRSSAGVAGLHVSIVAKGVGGDVTLAETDITGDDGTYQVSFKLDKQKPDLQARVSRNATFLSASDVHYNAGQHETLNVLLDEQSTAALQSEHETLTSSLKRQFAGKLSELQETADRQDITYLANKIGWDARAVALAALADQFSANATQAQLDIEPSFFYALFRAGLPANDDALYALSAKTAGEIWKSALANGVIPAALEARLPSAVNAFQKLVTRRVLDGPPAFGLSPLKEMLAVSLGDGQDPAALRTKQELVAGLYTQHLDDPDTFWRQIRENLGEPVERRMRLDGQLAYLTLNNAAAVAKLHGAHDLTQPIDLAKAGYYRTEKWLQDLTGLPVPPEITGKDDNERCLRYAEMLAAQVRLSFPTATVAQMVKDKELPLLDKNGQDIGDAKRAQVHSFLTTHEGLQLGVQPVEQFLVQKGIAIDQQTRPVVEEIKRIERVHAIAPTTKAANGLLGKGIDSAHAVTRYERDTFVREFKDQVGGEALARLIYDRARSVQNAVLNLAVSFALQQKAPGIGMHSMARIVDPTLAGSQKAGADVIAYPTLENLFGGLDFCACEHCRSMLSPAAYLVDLLHYLDRDEPVWQTFLAEWKAAHGNAPYPFGSMEDWQAAEQPADTEVIPLQVLLSRRPDIQHLPLTCENTNTPLPYIDLVNEVLEYHVASGSLADYSGHSTDGNASADELLANPQFVADEAYTKLSQAHFPSLLPFHQPLEAVRRYFNRFDAPLPRVMEALRKDERLDRASDDEYGWRDIWMEELGLSRDEYAQLTDPALPLADLYGFRTETTEAQVVTELSNAKQFARRMGISYEELVEILKTHFINPEGSAVSENAPDPAQVKNLIVLAGGDDCSFETLEFHYADPDQRAQPVRAIEFLRLARFIRLWRKLGWTIDYTDKAISALYPADKIPVEGDDETASLKKLQEGFLVLLPRLGIVRRVMQVLKLKPQSDLPSVLALFAPLDTHGEYALYRRMFLSPALLKQDPAFAADGFGNFLRNENEKIARHAETLRAAFAITGDELAQIMDALGFDSDTSLTLENISAVYRYGWLARALKISVREFLLLVRFTGINPFADLDPVTPPVLRFVELLSRLRQVSLKPTQALYLIWNQDLSGKATPRESDILEMVRTLRAGLAGIESEVAIVPDADGQLARAGMALVYGIEAADLFFGLVNRTFRTEVTYDHDREVLQQQVVDAGAGQIAYDDLSKKLSFNGVMTDATCATLEALPETPVDFPVAVKDLFDEIQKVVGPLFAKFPELQVLHDEFFASRDPEEVKRSKLFEHLRPELVRGRKREQALQAISAAAGTEVEFARALLDGKPQFTAPPLNNTPKPVYVLQAAGDRNRPALDDLIAVEAQGLSAQFFFRATADGNIDARREAEANLTYAPGSNPLPANGTAPGSPISGIWSGYVQAPEDGFYNVLIETEPDATVGLALGGATVILEQNGNVHSNKVPLELQAGTLYPVTLKVANVKDALSVRWQTRGRGPESIPPVLLYPAPRVDVLRQLFVRFFKAGSLAQALRLSADEIAYLGAHPQYRIDGGHIATNGQGWLNHLPVNGSPALDTSTALLDVLRALLDYARSKATYKSDDGLLLAAFQDPVTATHEPDGPLFSITGWDPASLKALLERFGKTRSHLADPVVFRRVSEAMGWVKQMGISAAALIAATTNNPAPNTVRALQSALRARFKESEWLQVLKPINDELRALQRDALVAHTLQAMTLDPATAHIDTPEKLFEFFLMDVQMEPCMQTSRVRHALSSVQLFIERSLMNLEPRVSPAVISAREWEWMNRYRVWEANRKVFLFPENWLEPELRDDRSPFFKETMSELLQSDITEDSAEVALLNYLSKLEEVAKLEPCGIYYEEDDSGTEAREDVIHVVARTAGANRKYFYCRYELGAWTPWEQIRLDIEDNPVVPVVWNNRLLLFWVRVLPQPLMDTQARFAGVDPGTTVADVPAEKLLQTDPPKVSVNVILCWSENYNGKWQRTMTSDVNKPVGLGQLFAASGEGAFDRSALRLEVSEQVNPGASSALVVRVLGQETGARFTLYNTHSLPVSQPENSVTGDSGGQGPARVAMLVRVLIGPKSRIMDTQDHTFAIRYLQESGFMPTSVTPPLMLRRSLFKTALDDRAVVPLHPLKNVWDAPFFYEDSRHVFCVTTQERRVRFVDWGTYAPIHQLETGVMQIPPLVQPELPSPGRPVLPSDGSKTKFGDVRPAAVKRFVTEDAFIHRGIGTTGTVRFGNIEVGPAGSLSNGNHKE